MGMVLGLQPTRCGASLFPGWRGSDQIIAHATVATILAMLSVQNSFVHARNFVLFDVCSQLVKA